MRLPKALGTVAHAALVLARARGFPRMDLEEGVQVHRVAALGTIWSPEASTAVNGAAADDDTHGHNATEREGGEGEVHDHRRLTTEAVVWSVTAGDDGRRRIRARTVTAGVGDDGSIPAIGGVSARATRRG